jgi:hypothetical protein
MVKGAMACLLAIAFLAVGCGGGDDQTEETRDTGTGGTAAGTGGTAAGTGGTAAGTGGTAAGTGGTASGGGETRASEVVGRWDIDRGGYADCGAEPTEWDSTIPGGPGFEFRLSDGQLTAGQCLGGATCSTGTYTDYRFELDEMGFVKARTRPGSIELDGMCYASRSTAVLQLMEGGQRLRYVETRERAPSASLGDGDCSEEPEGEYSCEGIEVREMIPYEG